MLFVQSLAKLNLFLELLRRREDGFHEIDTVMVAIDLRDDLTFRQTETPGIRLTVDWLPSRQVWANQLGLDPLSPCLDLPTGETNLVHRVVEVMADSFQIPGGWEITLEKRIPAGAGMGGASGNAAATILAVNQLANLNLSHQQLCDIGANLGSDIPFFLGAPANVPRTDSPAPDGGVVGANQAESGGPQPVTAAWATGRGEQITPIPVAIPLHFVVVYPSVSLSTARVYSNARVPTAPQSSARLRKSLSNGVIHEIGEELWNRLEEPASQMEKRIREIHESMWQSGLKAVQLTGSGSASFAIVESREAAETAVINLRRRFQPGALVVAASSLATPVPSMHRQL